MEKRWFTVGQAAEHFALSRKTFYSLIARKMIPEAAILRLGRAIRINVAVIEQSGVKK